MLDSTQILKTVLRISIPQKNPKYLIIYLSLLNAMTY